MLSDLFDSPWKVLILAIVILVLFGSKKLPDAARSLGKSMRILKTEIHDLHDEPEQETTTTAAAATMVAPAPMGPAPAPAQIAHQNQVDALQQQLDELRRQQQATVEAQQTQQVS
jgi:sec-independent protein translocase protein TatA